MEEGESSSVGWRIQALWKLLETGLAVPSPVGQERVRVRVVLLEMSLLSRTCFCTNDKPTATIVVSLCEMEKISNYKGGLSSAHPASV
jgi:hypothetical protein